MISFRCTRNNTLQILLMLWSSLSLSSSWTMLRTNPKKTGMILQRPLAGAGAAVRRNMALSATTTSGNTSKTSSKRSSKGAKASLSSPSSSSTNMINLQTIQQDELETILKSWGHPKYRAKQIYNWVRVQGVTNVDDMLNIPKTLKQQLKAHASEGSLELEFEQVSKDGTRKRAYKLPDGQLIESVLMPYQDGRYTACISSQAGCAQGCVFCATGQMGFSRQLTADEIYEQVARFSSELAYKDKHQDEDDDDEDSDASGIGSSSNRAKHNRQTRLSNIVFMGMGEPLANYRNVVAAVKRIQSELGIGHRKITISTVGIVPNIAKLAIDLPQVRLAVSLHCASDDERSSLLPANVRYGGLDRLMETLQEYGKTTGKRITLEWALIEHENDTPETAHKLGKLVKKWLRPDMVHINVIPLNPTGGYGGSPSGRSRVNAFCEILEKRYGVACTPRVRRGIDIDAGCGQLKAAVEKKNKMNKMEKEDDGDFDDDEQSKQQNTASTAEMKISVGDSKDTIAIEQEQDEDDVSPFAIAEDVVVMADEEDWEDYEYSLGEKDEVARLLALVKDTVVTEENAIVTGSASSTSAVNNRNE
mmetsp:Transcript_63276/g.95473  ORF Transcript_63276/g.95473 Transcript_63276/m.95473 type:complete len:590 (-) Transcript_63276:9-1778(-)